MAKNTPTPEKNGPIKVPPGPTRGPLPDSSETSRSRATADRAGIDRPKLWAAVRRSDVARPPARHHDPSPGGEPCPHRVQQRTSEHSTACALFHSSSLPCSMASMTSRSRRRGTYRFHVLRLESSIIVIIDYAFTAGPHPVPCIARSLPPRPI